MSIFSENLKRLRQSKGLTQGELAESVFASVQSISRWENGESEPSLDMVNTLCSFFGVTADKLIKGSDMPEDELMNAIKDYISSDSEFSEKSFKLCRSILDGRSKRMLAGLDDDAAIPDKCHYVINDRNGLDGVFVNMDSYPPLFAITDTKRLDIKKADAEKLCRVFSFLENEENINILLKAQDTDGWYDKESLIKHFGINEERFESVIDMFSELGMLNTTELAVNGSVKTVYALYFRYRVKLLLALAANIFSQDKVKYIW